MKKHYYASPFPCPLERTAASALLLLSTAPPHLSPPIVMRKTEEKCESSEMMSSLKSIGSSSVISTVTSSDEICSSSKLRIPPISTPLAARRFQIKLQVIRKSRSKNFRISDCRKASSEKSGAVSWGSESSEISTASNISSISSARSCSSGADRSMGGGEKVKKKQVVWSAHLSRRAEAIKGVLSSGGISEVRIRELLGDSPDTSKALRMLLRRAEVKRSGAGGRTDPFIYKIA